MTRPINITHQYSYALHRYREADRVSRRAQQAMYELTRLQDQDRRLWARQRKANDRGDGKLYNMLRRRRYKMGQRALSLKIEITKGCR